MKEKIIHKLSHPSHTTIPSLPQPPCTTLGSLNMPYNMSALCFWTDGYHRLECPYPMLLSLLHICPNFFIYLVWCVFIFKDHLKCYPPHYKCIFSLAKQPAQLIMSCTGSSPYLPWSGGIGKWERTGSEILFIVLKRPWMDTRYWSKDLSILWYFEGS